jgi:phosphatidylserine/phosphatidylglycerophosphate/cardiolipin synthase-like enzyme
MRYMVFSSRQDYGYLSGAFEQFYSDEKVFQDIEKNSSASFELSIWPIGRRAGYNYDTEPSDLAIVRLILLAQESLYISQQALFYLPSGTTYEWRYVIESLKIATLRGVKINILVSRTNEAGLEGHASASAKDVADKILEKIPESWTKLFTVRNLKNKKKQPARNHAKVVIVDEKYAYVGSHNLYPTSFFGPGKTVRWADAFLGEFGFIIIDDKEAKKLKEEYFDELWKQSAV